MKVPVIEVQNLSKTFPLGKVNINALRGVNLQVFPGEFLVINGPSGCGKTTLLNMVAGLDDFSSGDIFIRGRSIRNMKPHKLIRHRRSAVGMVFQIFNLIPSLSALDNVALPLEFSGLSRKERSNRALELLTMVGLGARAKHLPSELSGGEQQRVAIARAMVTNPWILLVDEPTGNLDSAGGAEIINLLAELNRKYKRTIILVTHNLQYGAVATRVLGMQDGVIVKEEKYPKITSLKISENEPEVPYFIASKIRDNMKVWDIIGLSYKHFKYAKTRSFLTVLGMVIGIAAIVLFVSLGFGLQKITTSSLATLEDLQTISAAIPENSDLKIDQGVIAKVKALEGVEDVSASTTTQASATLLEISTGVVVRAIEPEKLALEKINIASGQEQLLTGQAIVSETALKSFDISADKVLNERLHLEFIDTTSNSSFLTSVTAPKTLDLTVSGVSGEKLVPEIYLSAADLFRATGSSYDQLTVKVGKLNQVETVKGKLDELGFQTTAVSGLINQVNKAFTIIQIILGLIGGIALIVASFGIINTMIISLMERSHEIGIMKAIGISTKDVKRLFIYEALLFGFFGAVIGIFVGWAIGGAINLLIAYLMHKSGQTDILTPFITPWKFAVLVFFFGLFITRLAGVYPAWKAGRSSPLQSLRYE